MMSLIDFLFFHRLPSKELVDRQKKNFFFFTSGLIITVFTLLLKHMSAFSIYNKKYICTTLIFPYAFIFQCSQAYIYDGGYNIRLIYDLCMPSEKTKKKEISPQIVLSATLQLEIFSRKKRIGIYRILRQISIISFTDKLTYIFRFDQPYE